MNNKIKKTCIIIGHSIDAMSATVVLTTLGNHVQVIANLTDLNNTIDKYAFEHEVQALWKMYQQDGLIEVKNSSSFEKAADYTKVTQTQDNSVQAIWWFCDDTPPTHESIETAKDDTWESRFISSLNISTEQSIALILSGKRPIGSFKSLSQQIHRPWVYYVPSVFLQDGRAYSSMLNPSLWLLGEKTKDSWQRLTILQPLRQHATASYVSDINTIEFARSSIMGMLATRVSYMNEMSRLADSHDVDITTISQIMGLDKRIGASYLKAGWGFGGRTLPAELQVLSDSFANSNTDTQLISAVNAINDDQKELIFRKFWQHFEGLIEHKTVMIWGASYKSGSGRTLNSAIHPLLKLLWSYDINTIVCADKASNELERIYQGAVNDNKLTLVASPYESLQQVQAIFLINWDYEQPPETSRINEVAVPVFDAQNIFTNSQIAELKAKYFGIGR